MRTLAAVLVALAVAAGVAGCTPPHRDAGVPPSSSMWAACPHGDAGRIQDKWLRWPDWWVCVRA
jgi:hypothetical protein